MSELTRDQLLSAVIAGRGPAYLRGVDVSSLDLSGVGWLVEADLRSADLSHGNLSRAVLKNARLEGANLQGCNLVGANLEGADLRRARLNAANLRMANLAGADLQHARLVGSNLCAVNLTGANLEGADLEGANLEGADLREAKLQSANFHLANVVGVKLPSLSPSARSQEVPERTSPDVGPHQGFLGSMQHIHLSDVIQLACLARSNLLFQIESPRGKGTIHVRSGRVFHAQVDNLAGEKALFRMLQWDQGRFETFPLPDDAVVSIDKPIEHLLIESMRHRDEIAAICAGDR
ncbi:MAG TPA: pentapeptide repeat-containing protein [Syntrophobacteraceae bacterium]|nr:pentapeptide repeat-containing protein [Syntrophobacteraceae bacterium]